MIGEKTLAAHDQPEHPGANVRSIAAAASVGQSRAIGSAPSPGFAPWGGKPRKAPDIHDELLPDGSMLVLHTVRQDVLTLNPTAALIWECCDGEHDEAAIVAEVRALFPDAPDPAQDVRDLLLRLHESGMLAGEAA